MTVALLPGCLAFPFARHGPAEAHIEDAPPSDRFLVKGRAPYLIVPPISRIARQRLASGAIVRAEARDKVYAVHIHNDSALELWIRTFHEEGKRVPSFLCRDGLPAKLDLPHPIPPGEEATILLGEDREGRRIQMRLRTLIDRDDLTLRFDGGPFLSLGVLIVPFSRYDYTHLPAACRERVGRSFPED
jgi:hypothetical protein